MLFTLNFPYLNALGVQADLQFSGVGLSYRLRTAFGVLNSTDFTLLTGTPIASPLDGFFGGWPYSEMISHAEYVVTQTRWPVYYTFNWSDLFSPSTAEESLSDDNPAPYGAIVTAEVHIVNPLYCPVNVELDVCGRGAGTFAVFGALRPWNESDIVGSTPGFHSPFEYTKSFTTSLAPLSEKTVYLKWSTGGGSSTPAALLVQRSDVAF